MIHAFFAEIYRGQKRNSLLEKGINIKDSETLSNMVCVKNRNKKGKVLKNDRKRSEETESIF